MVKNFLIAQKKKKEKEKEKKRKTDANKTASKRVIQKTAEATVDLIGNKIADKITIVSKKILNTLKKSWVRQMANQKHQKEIHIARKKTTNYWLTEASIMI